MLWLKIWNLLKSSTFMKLDTQISLPEFFFFVLDMLENWYRDLLPTHIR